MIGWASRLPKVRYTRYIVILELPHFIERVVRNSVDAVVDVKFCILVIYEVPNVVKELNGLFSRSLYGADLGEFTEGLGFSDEEKDPQEAENRLDNLHYARGDGSFPRNVKQDQENWQHDD